MLEKCRVGNSPPPYSTARTVLYGGRAVTRVPTAIYKLYLLARELTEPLREGVAYHATHTRYGLSSATSGGNERQTS